MWNAAKFEQRPVIGILRGLRVEATMRVVESALAGGLAAIEITMDTPGAAEQIRCVRDWVAGRMSVGAGTVTGEGVLEAALGAGADFVVTPVVVEAVVTRCVGAGVPVFPGAYSPTEIARAWELGATMVKVFPAEGLGPGYVRALKAPLPQVRLMPTGGVEAALVADYRRAGADGFGVGGPLFRREWVEGGAWDRIEGACREFCAAWCGVGLRS